MAAKPVKKSGKGKGKKAAKLRDLPAGSRRGTKVKGGTKRLFFFVA